MNEIQILLLTVTEFDQNCRIIADQDTKEAVIIDPGGEAEKITALITKAELTPKAIWLTHSHLDHAGGVADLKKKFDIPLYANPKEALMRQKMPDIAAMYGLSASRYPVCPEPEHEIKGGEILKIGRFEFNVLFTPGHSPGHLCFYSSEAALLIAGDLVFAGSVGRTDLPGGDPKTLLQSIQEHILPLSDSTKVLSGHGPDTTIGKERVSNPFFPRGER